MNSPAQHTSSRQALRWGASLLMMTCLVFIGADPAFADPINDVTNGGTASSQVTTAMQNFVATILLVGAGTFIFGVIVMGAGMAFSGGSSKVAKTGFWISLGLLAIVGIIGSVAQLTQGIFNGIFGIGTA